MAGCRQVDDLLASVGHVKKRVAIDAEQAEWQPFDPVILSRLGLRHGLPRLDLVLRRLWLGDQLGSRLHRLEYLRPTPSLSDGVSQIPSVARSRRWRDDADLHGDPGEQLGDGARSFHAGLIPVRPDVDLPAGERRPVGEASSLTASRPCHDDSGRDAAGSVGCLLAFHDQHASVGIRGKQVQPVERARLGE